MTLEDYLRRESHAGTDFRIVIQEYYEHGLLCRIHALDRGGTVYDFVLHGNSVMDFEEKLHRQHDSGQ